MSVSLQKGQKISLTKDTSTLNKIIVGLGWDEVQAPKTGGKLGSLFGGGKKVQAIDCDASAILLKEGKFNDPKDVVYFGNLKHNSGAVMHMGDNLTGAGDGDDEQIVVELAKVPSVYDRIVLVVNIYAAVERKQHFGMISNAFIRIVDAKTNTELCKYNLTDNYQDMYAMTFGELYIKNGEWKFNAIGQGSTDASIKDIAMRFS